MKQPELSTHLSCPFPVFFCLSFTYKTFCFRLEGLMELYSQGCERSYTVSGSILRAIEPHLKDFQQLLLDPPKVIGIYVG